MSWNKNNRIKTRLTGDFWKLPIGGTHLQTPSAVGRRRAVTPLAAIRPEIAGSRAYRTLSGPSRCRADPEVQRQLQRNIARAATTRRAGNPENGARRRCAAGRPFPERDRPLRVFTRCTRHARPAYRPPTVRFPRPGCTNKGVVRTDLYAFHWSDRTRSASTTPTLRQGAHWDVVQRRVG